MYLYTCTCIHVLVLTLIIIIRLTMDVHVHYIYVLSFSLHFCGPAILLVMLNSLVCTCTMYMCINTVSLYICMSIKCHHHTVQ